MHRSLAWFRLAEQNGIGAQDDIKAWGAQDDIGVGVQPGAELQSYRSVNSS